VIIEILMFTLGYAVFGLAVLFVLIVGVLVGGAIYSSVSDFPVHLLNPSPENDTPTVKVTT
jgi:hypothetical protein